MLTGDFLTSRGKVDPVGPQHTFSVLFCKEYIYSLSKEFSIADSYFLRSLLFSSLLNRASYLIDSLLFLKFVEVRCFCC